MGFSDIVHGVLDVAGFIPVVGVVADVANAAVYAAEGDWGNAALSAMSAIPVVGDAAAVAGKSIKMISKISKASEKALSKAKKMKSLFAAMKGRAKTGAKKILKKLNRKQKARKQKKEAKKECTDGKCFTGDTLVYTKQGLCPIKEIRKGDDIYSRNMQTGEIAVQKVAEVFQTEAHTIHHIWLDGMEELKATAYHPVFVKEKGWVSAINLQEGNLLETLKGTAQVTKLEKTRHEEPVKVYNFHVQDWESYFVSEKCVYVHNGEGHENSGKYEVGPYKGIRGKRWLDAHHVGQKAVMKKFVEGYDPKTAPCINVPKIGHTILGPRGIVSRSTKGIKSARQLLARDIRELRRVYPKIPNSALRELIDMNKKMYPEMRKPR